MKLLDESPAVTQGQPACGPAPGVVSAAYVVGTVTKKTLVIVFAS